MNVLEKHGFTGISRWPSKEQLRNDDAIDKYFMMGLKPNDKLINKTTKITAFGSCFAGNVSRFLKSRGYSVNAHDWDHNQSDIIRIDEIMTHTPALLSQILWAFEDKPLGDIIIDGSKETVKSYHDSDYCKQIIKDTDFFILTLGLTEAWYDKKEGNYLWKFIPNKKIDPSRYENKFISFNENLENIKKIYSTIRKFKPNANILFTLSPIPLLGSYQKKSVIYANTSSKSTLRACIQEFISTYSSLDDKLFYFPSYELINYYVNSPWLDDYRHISDESIQSIMNIFYQHYVE